MRRKISSFLAISAFRKALASQGANRLAQEGLQRAQKLLDQARAQTRDYFKILGMER